MSEEKQETGESKPLSRREFFEETAVKGGAVLAATAATAYDAMAQGDKAAGAGNQKSQSSAAAKLMGEMVQYKSNDLMIPAYLSRANRKRAGAVLVIHEVFGLNDHIKSIADRIAREGFNALAPNLFVRAPEPPPSSDSTNVAAIRKAANSIPLEAAIRDMQAGLDYLKTMKDVRDRFASVGFCMGGGYSYQLSANSKDLAGAVIFYGRTPIELVPKVSCPILGNFGEQDQGIPPGTVMEFEEALKKAGKEADIKIYTGAGHGFFNDTRPQAYNAAAAADAWQRSLRFFSERLNS
ncbi:MAG TPA: dienelactone hydrolase family protein [Pyrinomonadaceae bacterium]|nr:dienelactone hydrolase family protein [Pyrinomonadaceae bacterium]